MKPCCAWTDWSSISEVGRTPSSSSVFELCITKLHSKLTGSCMSIQTRKRSPGSTQFPSSSQSTTSVKLWGFNQWNSNDRQARWVDFLLYSLLLEESARQDFLRLVRSTRWVVTSGLAYLLSTLLATCLAAFSSKQSEPSVFVEVKETTVSAQSRAFSQTRKKGGKHSHSMRALPKLTLWLQQNTETRSSSLEGANRDRSSLISWVKKESSRKISQMVSWFLDTWVKECTQFRMGRYLRLATAKEKGSGDGVWEHSMGWSGLSSDNFHLNH